MKAKYEEILHILNSTDVWVSASSFSKMLGVSERSIRNYINKINKDNGNLIESSKSGYKLKKNRNKFPKVNYNNYISERVDYILSRFIASKKGISIFDEAESLNISESTLINTVIPEIKKQIQEFNLKIESKNYQYYLKGNEKDKRKFIGNLVMQKSYGFFTSSEALEKLFPYFDVENVQKSLYNICKNSNLFINDYALNMLLLHILIILIRTNDQQSLNTLESGKDINKLIKQFEQKNEIIDLANNISLIYESINNQTIPSEEYQQIIILIALSINHQPDQIEKMIEKKFIDSVEYILNQVSSRYEIISFSKDFSMQFALHMYSALERSSLSVSYPNPLTDQIKKDYAPVYDMAVFISHMFFQNYHINLNEDEISFIAFHIGSYLENNQNYHSKINCILIIEEYHSISKNLVYELQQNFKNELNIIDVLSLNKYILQNPKCDLLITTVPLNKKNENTVIINPIITKQNIAKIWEEIEIINNHKKYHYAHSFLISLFHKTIYFRNINYDNKNEFIEFLGEKCCENNFIQYDFIKDVILRETLSNTAFTEHLAIPHAINKYAQKSFIAVIHNDTPITWGNKKVRFILMIGIAEKNMKFFNDAFNIIIDVFQDKGKVLKLLNTDTFEEFISCF